MRGSKVTWLLSPALHRGPREEKSRLPSLLLKISPAAAAGREWRCPQCLDTRVTLGGQWRAYPHRG